MILKSFVLEPIVLPHAVKVAVYLFVSAGLAGLLAGLVKLNLTPFQFVALTGAINWLLAVIQKWYEASKSEVPPAPAVPTVQQAVE